MKIQLLGTSAAPTWPDLFGNSEYDKKVRALGGKNIRSRSQSIIDDVHVIDWPADAFYHSVKYNIDFSQIRDVFVTHSHYDHFYGGEFDFASQGCYAYNSKYTPITLYGNKTVIEKVLPFIGTDLYLYPLQPYKSVTTPDNYKFTPLPASHSNHEVALNYIIEHQGKTVLYKVDSGPYVDENLWDFLKNYKFDCVITECTFNFSKIPHEDHEIYNTVLQLKNRLISQGSMDENTQMWLTHIHYIEGGMSHEEAEKICLKDNIHLGYDGVVINI